MASVRVQTNGREVVRLMKSAAVEAELERRARLVLAAAVAAAPVDSGSYRASLRVTTEQHPTRVVAHIGSDVAHALVVEANRGVLARALDAGR